MRTILDFTFRREGQESDDSLKVGITRVTDQLYFGGEEDVSDILPFVQVWVDLRDEGYFNRIVKIPSRVTYIRIPIADGDIERALSVFSKAKQIIQKSLSNKKKVVITCHAGINRSAVLVWRILAEQWNNPERSWLYIKNIRPCVEPDKRFLPFIRKYIYCSKNCNLT